MGKPKRRPINQMSARINKILVDLVPAGCAAVLIYHQPDDGSDPDNPGALNVIRWNGFAGPHDMGPGVIEFLRDMADRIEQGAKN